MKSSLKRMIAAIMTVIVAAMSVVTVFAVQYDNNNITYAYSEKGDCTVVVGDVYYCSNDFIESNEFEINGHIAVCAWGVNPTPTEGTYSNATKYYLDAGAGRAKAFYWLLLDNHSSISESNRYDSSSSTYLDDIYNAMDDCGALYKSTAYGFVHSVIDYLQQGTTNPWYDDEWNSSVVRFAELTRNYPNVPQEYRIFYFYPQGNAAQSLMSWEESPHGYIKVIKSSSDTSVTDGNAAYTFKNIEYYVSKSSTDFDTNGSNYLGYIKLNENGEGHSKDGSRATLRFLPPGTYYVKEGYIPNGCSYERDDTVYSVTVPKSHTTTSPFVLMVSDTPKTVYGKIVKSSSNPELTDGNPDYSFEGIRYLFSKSPTDFSAQSSNYLGYVALDRNGVAFTANGSRNTLKKLAPGTYYVKESYIPSGCNYKLDSTVYTMTFTFDNDQNNLAVLNVCDDPEGSSSVRIVKRSSTPEVSDGNSEYSIKNAEFTVYRSRSDAEQKTNPFTKVITDENGVAVISEMGVGTYYVRETKAPYGFELSEEIKELSIDAVQEEAIVVEFDDKPVIKPLSVLLQKRVAAGSQAYGLSGAEYTVNYYNRKYNSAAEVAGISPTRTWVFRTDSSGNIAYSDDYLVSGDDLYYDSTTAEYGLPLGTVTIQETKAPAGFYLDEQVYFKQITINSGSGVIAYNNPVSNEQSIPVISITGTKTWNDDNNCDGKRPASVTIQLYRDNIRIDSFTMNESNGWHYEFNNLDKGYADIDRGDLFHEYLYEVVESDIEHYTSESTGLKPDSSDTAHYTCDFINHYISDKTSVNGIKTWDDMNDCMGYRPNSIKVILYRDGVKVDEAVTSQDNDWAYSFSNLNKYHDGGTAYVYTVGEEPVSGYTVGVNGHNLKNTLHKGSVSLFKGDNRGLALEGVSFRLFTADDKAVSSITNGSGYKFWELTSDEARAVYTTDSNGMIHIDDLPYGSYYFEETETLLGFIPYGEKIRFEIADSDEPQEVFVDVENAKTVMPETGGSGSQMFYIISIMLTGIGLSVLCLNYHKNSKMKGNY